MSPDAPIIIIAPIVLSLISIIVSIVCFVLSYRQKKHEDEQNKELAAIQLKLQSLQLAREEQLASGRSLSKVEARHVLIGTKTHKLRISNTGGAVATNITCEVNSDNGPYSLIQDKEPFERLEPGESFDEIMVMVMGTPSKFPVITHWFDQDGNPQSRENIVTW